MWGTIAGGLRRNRRAYAWQEAQCEAKQSRRARRIGSDRIGVLLISLSASAHIVAAATGAGTLEDRRVGVRPVDLVQVDVVCVEAAQAGFDGFIVEAFCTIDDALVSLPAARLRTRGPAPVLADSEVLSLEAAGSSWAWARIWRSMATSVALPPLLPGTRSRLSVGCIEYLRAPGRPTCGGSRSGAALRGAGAA
jgi:hypothetical protein